MNTDKLAIYQTASGAIELSVDATTETIWATHRQMAGIFDVEVPAINKHITNIIKEDELDISTVSKKEIVQKESGREVKRLVSVYNMRSEGRL